MMLLSVDVNDDTAVFAPVPGFFVFCRRIYFFEIEILPAEGVKTLRTVTAVKLFCRDGQVAVAAPQLFCGTGQQDQVEMSARTHRISIPDIICLSLPHDPAGSLSCLFADLCVMHPLYYASADLSRLFRGYACIAGRGKANGVVFPLRIGRFVNYPAGLPVYGTRKQKANLAVF